MHTWSANELAGSYRLVAPLHAQDSGTPPSAVVAVAAPTVVFVWVMAVHLPDTAANPQLRGDGTCHSETTPNAGAAQCTTQLRGTAHIPTVSPHPQHSAHEHT